MNRYSEMSKQELYAEMQKTIGEARKKHQAGFLSEANILEQKYYMAKSYMMDPKEIKLGEQYHVAGETGVFLVDYMNGVFAWGRFPHSQEDEAFPIGRLEPVACESKDNE